LTCSADLAGCLIDDTRGHLRLSRQPCTAFPGSRAFAIPREKFTKERSAAKTFAKGFFERYPKNPYQTEVEGWRHLQSANVELTMKRLREPIER